MLASGFSSAFTSTEQCCCYPGHRGCVSAPASLRSPQPGFIPTKCLTGESIQLPPTAAPFSTPRSLEYAHPFSFSNPIFHSSPETLSSSLFPLDHLYCFRLSSTANSFRLVSPRNFLLLPGASLFLSVYTVFQHTCVYPNFLPVFPYSVSLGELRIEKKKVDGHFGVFGQYLDIR